MDSVACMSLCAHMQSNPFSTLTKAKTRSKPEWSWACSWQLMRMTTSTHWKISTNTMHQCVAGSAAPKNTMRMLANELDGGAISIHPDTTEARVRLSKMSPWRAYTSSWTTKLGISFPLSTIMRMLKSWSHHNDPSVSDVFHGFLKPFSLTWVHLQIVCNVFSSGSSSFDS